MPARSVFATYSGGRSVPIATGPIPRPVARLQLAGSAEESPVEREQVGLGQRPFVGHRDAEQDLALPLGVANDRPACCRLGLACLARDPCPLVKERHDPPIERIDLPAQSA